MFHNSQHSLFSHIHESFYFDDNLFIVVLKSISFSYCSNLPIYFLFSISIYFFYLPIYLYNHFSINIIFYFKYLRVLIFLLSVLANVCSCCLLVSLWFFIDYYSENGVTTLEDSCELWDVKCFLQRQLVLLLSELQAFQWP